MKYIMKTTRIEIEIVSDEIYIYDFNKIVEINDVECNMFLIKK